MKGNSMREDSSTGKQIRKWCAGLAGVVVAGGMAFSSVGVANAESISGQSDQQAVSSSNGMDTKSGPLAREDRVDVSNVRVSEVGAHTANLTFDYKVINPKGSIKEFIPYITMDRIMSVTQKVPVGGWGSTDVLGDGSTGFDDSGVADNHLTQETYKSVYGIGEHSISLGDRQVGSYKAQTFSRWIYSKDLGTQEHQNSGTMSIALIGLDQSTLYATRLDQFKFNGQDFSNRGVSSAALGKIQALNPTNDPSKFNKEIPVDMTRLMVGVKARYDESVPGVPATFNDFRAFLKQVPDFTTVSEPQSLAENQLNGQNQGDMQPGQVQSNQSSRFYINSLKQECKVKVDAGHDCIWYSYIYSDPVRLNGPEGAPYVRIQKDEQNRYFFDAFIPGNYQGDHRVSLVDENGQVQAWVPVRITGKDVTVHVDKSELNAAIDAASKLVQSDYTENSWAAFTGALKAARDASAKSDVSQSWVDAVLKNLIDMQGKLVKVTHQGTANPGNQTVNKGQQQDPKDKGKLAQTGSDLFSAVFAALALSLLGAGMVLMRRIRS